MARNGRLKMCLCVFAKKRPLIEGTSLIGLYRGRGSYTFLTFAGNALISRTFYTSLGHVKGLCLTVDLRNFSRMGSLEQNANMFTGIVRTVSLLGRGKLIFNASVYCASGGCGAIADSRFVSVVIRGNYHCTLCFRCVPIKGSTSLRLLPGPGRELCVGSHIHRVEGVADNGKVFAVSFRGSNRFIKNYVTKKEGCFRVGTGNSTRPYMFVRCSKTGVHARDVLRVLGRPLFVTCRSGRPFGRGRCEPYPVLRGPRVLRQLMGRANTGSASLRSPRDTRRLYGGYGRCTRT